MPKSISASSLCAALLFALPTATVHSAPTAEMRPTSFAAAKKPTRNHVRKPQTGKASYYANRFNGRRTASGHLYYQDAYTAAHRTLPLGTWVKVTNIRNQRSVVVQITDRGPFADPSRIIDLSHRSASDLEMRESGVVPVRLEVVQEYIKPEA
jgi:rare lipoprotein A